MRLVKIPRVQWRSLNEELRPYNYYIARVFVEGTEEHRAVLNDWGLVVGAISYSIEPDRIRVYSLGSILSGAGSRLMNHVERLAAKHGVPVRLAAERAALGFYFKRGYTPLPGQSRKARIVFVRKVFTPL